MYCVEKTWKFRIGHRLRGHPKCGNVHGEWMQVTLTWGSDTLDENGMVVDFGVLSDLVGKKLEELFDHVFLVDKRDTQMLKALEMLGVKYLEMEGAPTAENIAKFIYREFRHVVPRCELVRVKVVESENNTAYYTEEC